MNLPTRIHSHFDRLASALRVIIARIHGVRIGPRCAVATGVIMAPTFAPAKRGQVIVGADCTLETGVVLHPYRGKIHLGDGVFLGPYVVVYGNGGVEIGSETLIAMHSRILSSEHAMAPLGCSIRSLPDELKRTRIGRDVWIGAGVTILGGVTLGDGCVIGAGAVVTHDIPTGAIAVGVPARVVGTRPGPIPPA